jgi:hypothetical protein
MGATAAIASAGRGAGALFTRLNRPVRILSKAIRATKGEALRVEYAFKQVSRADKLQWCATALERFVVRDRRLTAPATPAIFEPDQELAVSKAGSDRR